MKLRGVQYQWKSNQQESSGVIATRIRRSNTRSSGNRNRLLKQLIIIV